MQDSNLQDVHENSSAGHLSVHLDAAHASDIPFLFEQQSKRVAPAAIASLGSHALFVLFAILLIRYRVLGGQARTGS